MLLLLLHVGDGGDGVQEQVVYPGGVGRAVYYPGPVLPALVHPGYTVYPCTSGYTDGGSPGLAVREEGGPGLKTAPWAWVRLPWVLTLPRVVTLPRENPPGSTTRAREERAGVWIVTGHPRL